MYILLIIIEYNIAHAFGRDFDFSSKIIYMCVCVWEWENDLMITNFLVLKC